MSYRYSGQKPNLSASEINKWNAASDAFIRGGSGVDARVGDSGLSSQSTWVWVRNDSGGTMSRFETMALGSPIFNLELDGSVDPIFSADTSDPDEQPVVLIDEIGDGELGRGVIDGLAFAIVETGSGAYAKPTTGGKLEPGETGGIKLLTSPGGSDTLCAVLLGVRTPGIIDLRLDGNNLQYTLDGDNWTTWHTGGPCPE